MKTTVNPSRQNPTGASVLTPQSKLRSSCTSSCLLLVVLVEVTAGVALGPRGLDVSRPPVIFWFPSCSREPICLVCVLNKSGVAHLQVGMTHQRPPRIAD